MANEKRLIDANELESHFHETKMIEIFPYWKELSFKTQSELIKFGKALKEMMQNAPTVDAVEVVRCKDCIHRVYVDMGDEIGAVGGCELFGCAMHYNAYCYYGERKDND